MTDQEQLDYLTDAYNRGFKKGVEAANDKALYTRASLWRLIICLAIFYGVQLTLILIYWTPKR